MIVHANKIWRHATDRIYARGLPVIYVYAGTHLVYPESKPYDGRYNLVQNGYAGRIAINGIPITGTARESVRYNLPLGSHGLSTDNTNLDAAIRSRLGTDAYHPLFRMNQGNWGKTQLRADGKIYQACQRGTSGTVTYSVYNVPQSTYDRTVCVAYYGTNWQSSQTVNSLAFNLTTGQQLTLQQMVSAHIIEPVVLMSSGSESYYYFSNWLNVYTGGSSGSGSYATGSLFFTLLAGIGILSTRVYLARTTATYSASQGDSLRFCWYNRELFDIRYIGE